MSDSPNAKHHETHGSVFCPQASLWFPTVYQLTWPHLQGQNSTTWPHFTIDKSGYDETARLSQIASLPANAAMSILIKHHRTKEEAVAFLSAISIFDPSQHCSGFTETRYGLFTLSAIPTYHPWPGPLLIFETTSASSPFGTHDGFWTHAIAPTIPLSKAMTSGSPTGRPYSSSRMKTDLLNSTSPHPWNTPIPSKRVRQCYLLSKCVASTNAVAQRRHDNKSSVGCQI
jgi:hypothetical protein